MSIKHRKGGDTEYKRKENNYLESKHTRNEYQKFLKTAKYDEILSEYQKLALLKQMMKHKGLNSIKPYPDRKLKQDNIMIIKYKYNLICQEIAKREYRIMEKDYKKTNVRYSK